jgi:hypothetical protein
MELLFILIFWVCTIEHDDCSWVCNGDVCLSVMYEPHDFEHCRFETEMIHSEEQKQTVLKKHAEQCRNDKCWLVDMSGGQTYQLQTAPKEWEYRLTEPKRYRISDDLIWSDDGSGTISIGE